MSEPVLRKVTVRCGSILSKAIELRERFFSSRIVLEKSGGVMVEATVDTLWMIDSNSVVGLYIRDEV